MTDNYGSYHEGELEVQARARVGSDGLPAESMYRSTMPVGVQRFLAAQQLAVLSTSDADGRQWASMRSGEPGFLRAIDGQTLEIGGYSHPDDPLLKNLASSSETGMLAIQLAARQRVRVNGVAQVGGDGRITLKTHQVYGNCPQYIQARSVTGREAQSKSAAKSSKSLNRKQTAWLEQADTFFIATAHFKGAADASHRGGKPGFVKVESNQRLLFPDYSGNNMFNTLGNLASNPRAGLLFPDFSSGAALQVSGKALVLWDDPRTVDFHGAQRLIEFEVERVVELPQATLLHLEFRSYAADLP